jgi:hypothetical protein
MIYALRNSHFNSFQFLMHNFAGLILKRKNKKRIKKE